MSLSDIFFLYLLPWVVGISALFAAAGVSSLATLVTGKVFRRVNTLASSVVGALLALAFLRVSFSHSILGIPLFLQLSLSSYGACGLLSAWFAMIGIWAVVSEQADNLKRDFAAGDRTPSPN